MNKFILASFYTKKTPYQDIMYKYLVPSCNKLNLDINVYETENTNNWYNNVAQKPRIIGEILKNMEEDASLVFIDADATIEKYPILFDKIPEKYDIAFHYLSWNNWYCYTGSDVKELLTGTMLFRNREKIRKLCKEWHKKAIQTREWEQKVLQKIIQKYSLTIYQLPIEYCYLKTLPNGREPFIKCNPVIVHYQMSRKYKRTLHLRSFLNKRKK